MLSDHLELLCRVARRLCGSHEDAEDLVQDTLAGVLSRPRLLHSDSARGYLLRALRNTQATQYRAAMCRPTTVPLLESDLDDHTPRASIPSAVDPRCDRNGCGELTMSTSSPRIAEIEYLVEIAKDWTVACFASAQSSEFHRRVIGP